MGEILFRTKLSEDMFAGLAPWLGRLPGRLVHVNILGCAVFAAVSGSSAATAMTVGKMSIPELSKRGYDEKLIIGSLAGSGTLGLLIPPSIILIVYGRLGGGLDRTALHCRHSARCDGRFAVHALCRRLGAAQSVENPGLRHPDDAEAEALVIPAADPGHSADHIRDRLDLIVAGPRRPRRRRSGFAGALILSALTGSLNRHTFSASLMGATRTSCMIIFIYAGAAFLSVAMGYTGIPRALAMLIQEMQLSPYMLLVALTLLFVILGCFLDGISVVVLTTAVILPMVQAAGIDLIWFGIYLVLVVEMSQITPPVGFNLFVLQGLTGRNSALYRAGSAAVSSS